MQKTKANVCVCEERPPVTNLSPGLSYGGLKFRLDPQLPPQCSLQCPPGLMITYNYEPNLIILTKPKLHSAHKH